MNPSIPLRQVLTPPLQASRWQKSPLLVDVDEMQSLLVALGQFWIVQVSGVMPLGQEMISQDSFLEVYRHYIEALKKGENPTDSRVRPYFSAIFTTYLDALYAVQVNPGHGLVKVLQPVVQLQAHRFDYSSADGTFRSMVMGNDSIPWGIQFSYPHLYQNENLEVLTVREGAQFPNTSLYKKLQQWVRVHTIATPFEIEGKRVNVPIRLGKQCLTWINTLSQLTVKKLRVFTKFE
jgi:hypothetical protein